MPDLPRQIMCIPIAFPSKYFPLVLYFFFALLSYGSPPIDLACSIAVGYLYSFGYFDPLRPSQVHLAQLENYGFLSSACQTSGWVLAGNAAGHASLYQRDPVGLRWDYGASATTATIEPFPGTGNRIGREGVAATSASSYPTVIARPVFPQLGVVASPMLDRSGSSAGESVGSSRAALAARASQAAELRKQQVQQP